MALLPLLPHWASRLQGLIDRPRLLGSRLSDSVLGTRWLGADGQCGEGMRHKALSKNRARKVPESRWKVTGRGRQWPSGTRPNRERTLPTARPGRPRGDQSTSSTPSLNYRHVFPNSIPTPSSQPHKCVPRTMSKRHFLSRHWSLACFFSLPPTPIDTPF